MRRWLVRIYRYDGSDSTVGHFDNQDEAEWMAASLNEDSQSTQYRVEEYDPEKMRTGWPT